MTAASLRISFVLLALWSGGCSATGAAWADGPAAGSDKNPPARGWREERWYVLMLGEGKCGQMHSVTRRVKDQIRTDVELKFELARGSDSVSIGVNQHYLETLDGHPLAFKQVEQFGKFPRTMIGKIKDGRLRLVTEQLGMKSRSQYEFDPEIRFAWGQSIEQRRRTLKTGTTFKMKGYDPSLDASKPFGVTFHVDGEEVVDVLGTPRKLAKVRSVIDLQLPITTSMWVTLDWAPIVTSMQMGGFTFMAFETTKEVATAKKPPPEMFASLMVNATGSAVPKEPAKLTLRLRVSKGTPGDAPLPDLPDTGMQTFERINEREALLRVRRIDWKPIRAAVKYSIPAEAAELLKASSVVDTGDSEIQRLAKEGVGKAVTPAAKADALRRFVTEYVHDKNMNIGFATASEVARRREGDCTEHSVLLAALARVAGIPSRGVSGLMGMPGEAGKTRFGYHMWTQVYIGGKWVDIDAAMRQTECDATHIALRLVPLNDDSVVDSALALMPLLGRLELEVVESE